MVGVQDEDAIHCLGQYRADRFDLGRCVEHHVQEVFRVVQVVARIHQRLAHRILVDHGRDGRHLRDQAVCGNFTMLGVIDVQRVMVEGGQGADDAAHHGHRVSVATETVKERLQLLVNDGVVLDGVDELGFLLGGRQFAVQQQIAGFEVVGFFRQLLDRVATMQQDALVAIDVGDLGLARGGRHEAGIEGETTRGGQASYVNYVRPYGAGQNGQFDGFGALDNQLRFVVSHVWPPVLCLESSWPPTQGPHHYSEINLKVNLRKPVSQRGFLGEFATQVVCLRHLYIGRHQPLVALHHIVISDLTVYTRKPTGRGLTGSFL